MVAGNYNLQDMDSMISDKANLGFTISRDGVWKNAVTTINEYFEAAKHREFEPYYEPVNAYKIIINKGQMALVWADATLHSYGVLLTNNIDNFTLIKRNQISLDTNGHKFWFWRHWQQNKSKWIWALANGRK